MTPLNRLKSLKPLWPLWSAVFGLVMLMTIQGLSGLAKDTVSNAASQSQSGLPEVGLSIAGKAYRVEVASTPEQTEAGLMHRTVLPAGRGMLFRFEEVRPVAFWMKNTPIPLDMLFIRANQVVHIVHNAQPCIQEPCQVYPSEHPVDMVIELPGGTARRDRISTGSLMEWVPDITQSQPLINNLKTKQKTP